jgi:hypothetical protein
MDASMPFWQHQLEQRRGDRKFFPAAKTHIKLTITHSLDLMNARRLLFALSCTVLALAPARAQLIQNGGFETGDFTSWDTAGPVEI